jgi:hypothetical protein
MIVLLLSCLFVQSAVVTGKEKTFFSHETNLIISYIALEGNLDLGPEVFLEQPKNATVQELETAVFRCSIINTSFEIYWRLNDSDAGHSKFDDIGYRVVFPNRYDHTVSRMEIAGRLRNNNTIVHCAAVGEEPVLSWTDSERARLIVQEATSHSTFQHELAHTSQHSLLPTQTVELIEASVPSQSVTSSQNPTPNDDTEQSTAIVLFGTIGKSFSYNVDCNCFLFSSFCCFLSIDSCHFHSGNLTHLHLQQKEES